MRKKVMVKNCINCNAPSSNRRRCSACHTYLYRNKIERPLNVIENEGRNHRYMTLEQRLLNPSYQETNNKGCWLWKGEISENGYGRIRANGKSSQYVHIVCYEHFRGKVPDGLELDHLCRIRHCFNPEHLEPVTRKVNLSRGNLANKYGMTRNVDNE